MAFLCTNVCVPHKEEGASEMKLKTSKTKNSIISANAKPVSRKSTLMPGFANKGMSRACVKVIDSKPFNVYKNLLDVSNINEAPSVKPDPTPITNITEIPKKLFKRPYKPWVDCEVVRASKNTTKRKTDVLYDSEVIYGAPTKTVPNSLSEKKINMMNKSVESLNRISENDENSDIDTNYVSKVVKSGRKGKKENSRKDEFNDNFDVLFKGQIKEDNYQKFKSVPTNIDYTSNIKNYNSNYQNSSIDQITNEDNNVRKKPFEDLKENIKKNKKVKEMEENSEGIMYHDRQSCPYCEEIYKIVIFENKPIKVFNCFYCSNLINANSLDFYYKKYEKDLIVLNKRKVMNQFNENLKRKSSENEEEEEEENKKIEIERKRKAKEKERRRVEIEKEKEIERQKELEREKEEEEERLEEERREKEKKIQEKEKEIERKRKEKERKEKEEEKKRQNLKKQEIVEKEESQNEELTKVQKKSNKVVQEPEQKQEKVANFDSEWVNWNDKMMKISKKENPRKENQLIEIDGDDSELKGVKLSDAFKNRKSNLVKRFENRQKVVDNQMIEEKKEEESNITKNDLANNTTTFGDSMNMTSKQQQKKSKTVKNKNKEEFKNEPPQETIDRLIYGKKVQLNPKEIKDVNKRLYNKLVETKEKLKIEESEKKKEEKMRFKENEKTYSEKLKQEVIKKPKI